MKRIPFLALSMALVIPVTDGVAEPKKNELFGFGRKRDQISNALFPEVNETAAAAPQNSARPEEKRDSDSIFRGGKPKKVEGSAYVIRDGEKVEQPLPQSKTKPSFFSKFKKEPTGESPILTATNGEIETVEKREAPVVAAPATPVVESSSPDARNAISLAATPVEEAMEEEKSGNSFFSFFNRDKKEKVENTTLTPIPAAGATEAADTVAVAAPVSRDMPAPAATKPAPPRNVEEKRSPAAEVPQFAGAPEPREKEKKGFSLPNPIAALKPDPKPVSLVGAETIIENGEIVGETEDIVDSNIVKTGDGKKDPPRIVDGVKTYESWEDVEGRNVSAADRILSQMRSR